MKKIYLFLLIFFIPFIMIMSIFFSYNYWFEEDFSEKQVDQYLNDLKNARGDVLVDFIYDFQKDVVIISSHPDLMQYFETREIKFLNSFSDELIKIGDIKEFESFQIFNSNDELILSEGELFDLNVSNFDDGAYLFNKNGFSLVIVHSLFYDGKFFGKVISSKKVQSLKGFNSETFSNERVFLIDFNGEIIYSSFEGAEESNIEFLESCFSNETEYLYVYDYGYVVYSRLENFPYCLALDFTKEEYEILFEEKHNYLLLFGFILLVSFLFYFIFFHKEGVVKK